MTGIDYCRKKRVLTAAVAAVAIASAAAQSLEDGFKAPPLRARPLVWYHMMNGNVTKEGVTCDFEALAAAGFGGVQMFDAGCDIPAGPLQFNTPEWFELMRHAHKEAKRLGLEMGVANCSGWSSSGGPWITPDRGMKVVVTTETQVKGPTRFSNVLPRTEKDNGFYADIAVLAYPTPAPGAKLTNLAAKTGAKRDAYVPRDVKEFAPDQVVGKKSIINLTVRMGYGGRVEWDVPEGDWTILRAGFICNGRRNHPASKNGLGLEVDKFSASALDFHFAQYAGRLCRELGVSAKTDNTTGLNNILIDSWEVGSQTWTQDMETEFERRAGYSAIPYLPVFSGRVVDSVAASERFLEDFRRVQADLFTENHAQHFAALCHAHGLTLTAEPYGNSNADNFRYGAALDAPMGNYWLRGTCADGRNGGNTHSVAPISHVWGKRFVALEACTSGPPGGGRWNETPYSTKHDCDMAFADGGNRLFFHRFTHQPWPGAKYLPGMTMGRWGMHVDRTQTWWSYAKGWTDYLSRCQWMLQEGKPVADVLIWCGDVSPNNGTAKVALPKEFDWDFCDTPALLQCRVVNGKIVTPGGGHYALLSLREQDAMSETTLLKLSELLDGGAKIASTSRPSSGKLVDSVWSKGVMNCSMSEALKRLSANGDVVCPAKDVRWCHRRDGASDWYFVARDNAEETSFEASFRTTGRIPEIWDAETGDIAEAAQWRTEAGRTVVTLDFRPRGSAFVVFRRKSSTDEARRRGETPHCRATAISMVEGPWQVSFPVEWYNSGNAVKTFDWPALKDWTTDDDPDVKYFSGTATYRVKCPAPSVAQHGRIFIDLGNVKDFAVVKVNGREYPPLWRPPFRVDVTDALKSPLPAVDLEIRVTNLWPNRLIGDDTLYQDDCEWKTIWHNWAKMNDTAIAAIPQWVSAGRRSPTGRKTFTTWKHWKKGDALLPSGLLGPVTFFRR